MNNEMCGCNETCAAEEKTPSAKGIVRINYKEDFELVVELLAGDKPYRLGDEDFRIDFMVMASRYTVGRTAGVCERCMVVGVNKVRCFMDGHGLPPGELRAEVKVNTPDPNYADGKRLSVATADGVVVLVNDNTRFDGAVVTANIPVVLIDAYQLARERGYKGTMDEYYATFSDVSVLMAGLRDASQAESRRREVDKERDALVEKMRAAWQDIERMCEIRKGEYARELELVERIRNAPKDPTQDVWLDATDGEVKSGPAEGNLTSKALAYYYLGRRMVRGSFTGASREDGWLGCKLVRHLDVRGWDMTLCTDASLKFQGYSNLRFLDTSGWSLAALTNGYYMFANCGSLQTLDTSNWNLSSLKSADSMFSNCGSLQTLDTSNWSLAALTNGYQMFANCGSLQTLDASNWNLSSLKSADSMFSNCGSLQTLDTSNWSLAALTNGYQMFSNCGSLQTLDASNWNLSSLKSADSMFSNCGSLQTLDTSNWSLAALTNGYQMFSNCGSLQTLDTSNWSLAALTNGYQMFANCGSLQTLDTSNWSLAALTNGYQMFANCGSLQTLDASNWNLSSLKSADSMFSNCGSLQTLDTSNWSLAALTNGYQMFSNCGSLQTLDTSNWSLAALTNGYQMFANCGSLQTLDASKWSLAALTNGSYMFLNCANLRRLDMRGSSFHLVAEMARPFGGCNHMEELWLPMTFDKLSSLDLSDIPSWGITEEGLKSLRWTFGDGAEDRTAKGLQPCTVRLHVNVYDRLTDEERAAAAKKGWTITK